MRRKKNIRNCNLFGPGLNLNPIQISNHSVIPKNSSQNQNPQIRVDFVLSHVRPFYTRICVCGKQRCDVCVLVLHRLCSHSKMFTTQPKCFGLLGLVRTYKKSKIYSWTSSSLQYILPYFCSWISSDHFSLVKLSLVQQNSV